MLMSLTACSSCSGKEQPIAEPTPEVTTVVEQPTPEVKAEPTVAPTPEKKEPEPEVVQKPEAEPTAEPKPEPTVEPTPEPKVEEVKAVSLEAKVGGNHNVGDTLSASDFTVTVKMSDGSTLKNPAGWQADKLTLDSESTKITVTYGELSSTVTVKAVAQQAQQPAPEPQQPARKYPASAYEPISQQAKEDFYNHTISHGAQTFEVINSYNERWDCVGWPMENGDYIAFFGIHYYEQFGKWGIVYGTPKTSGIQNIGPYNGTLEFLYDALE